jgi:uncharacterized protein
MKMQPDQSPGINLISAYDASHFAVNGQRFEEAILVPMTGTPILWRPSSFDAIGREDLDAIIQLNTELIILGTGRQHRFPKPEWLIALNEKRIGLEAMSTAAALRTYNILAGEGRSVSAALLLDR